MRKDLRQAPRSQDLRRTTILPKGLVLHKGMTPQAFRILAAKLAHKPTREPSIPEAGKLVGVGRDGCRRTTYILKELQVVTADGTVCTQHRVNKKRYVRLDPAVIFDHTLSDLGLWVLAALSAHTDRAGFCFPKIPTLATRLGVSERGVTRALKELTDRGLTVDYRRPNGPSWRFVLHERLYTLTSPPDLPVETQPEEIARIAARTPRLLAEADSPADAARISYARNAYILRVLLYLLKKKKYKNQGRERTTDARPAGGHPPCASPQDSQASQDAAQRAAEDSQRNPKRDGIARAGSVRVGDAASIFRDEIGPPDPGCVFSSPAQLYACETLVSVLSAVDRPEAGSTHARLSAPALARSPGCKPSLAQGSVFDATRQHRLRKARNRFQRQQMLRETKLSLCAWDCNTLRAIDAGAVDARRTDYAKGRYFPLWEPIRWREESAVSLSRRTDMRRGHGLFKLGKLGGSGSPESVQPRPEFVTDDADGIFAELNSELRLRHGEQINAMLPATLSKKERGQFRNLIQNRFNSTQLTNMVRVLVWDWEEIRQIGFPRMPRQPYPNVNALVLYADLLVQHVLTGVPSADAARRGRSGYAERYLSKATGQSPPAKPRGVNLDQF